MFSNLRCLFSVLHAYCFCRHNKRGLSFKKQYLKMVQDYNKAPEYQCISHGVKLIKSPYPMLLSVILQIKHKLTLRYQH